MNSPLETIILFARDMKKTAVFYSEHFGFETTGEIVEGLIELRVPTAAVMTCEKAGFSQLGE